jgi:hypothetical protein
MDVDGYLRPVVVHPERLSSSFDLSGSTPQVRELLVLDFYLLY